MAGRERGGKSALVLTDRSELADTLADALDALGFATRCAASFDLLDTHADARPELVVADLALSPGESGWSTLARLFPQSVLWALADRESTEPGQLSAAFRYGCQDCLFHPLTARELAEKLAALERESDGDLGELDPYMSTEIKLELPSELSIIQQVAELLAGRCRDFRSYSPRTLVNLRIALSEALSNAVLYGNVDDRDKKVRVRVSVNAFRIQVQVSDEGPGFDPAGVRNPTRPEAIDASGGRGLFLLQQLADDIRFNERGNSVTLTFESDWEEGAVRGPARPGPAGPAPLIDLVERIRALTDVDLRLWEERPDGKLQLLAPDGMRAPSPDDELKWLRTSGARYAVEVPASTGAAGRWAEFARDLLESVLNYERQLAEARRDAAERQEEIELLHSVTETLGVVTRLEDAADQILQEVVRVTGAGRASLWIRDPETDELVLAASEWPARVPVDRVSVTSPSSVSALAFRENRTVRLDEEADLPEGLASRLSPKPDPWVAVPVSYTSPGGETRTLGVLNLIGRRTGSAISGAGETRLLTTLARQIGSAIQNLRLFEEILARERVIGEMELARDLQTKLLPDLSEYDEVADVCARCVPARPVGGDFYQLFRLSDDMFGAMLGDVTSHGFGASLIMALSMSATGIYARETRSPGDLLRAIHRALIQKLESADTFMTFFYGVINRRRGTLCYANAGHAHAFRLHGEDPPERLEATSPPLGVAEYGSYGERSVPWEGTDLLCLFTDGLTNPSLRTTEEAVIDAVSRARDQPAAEIVEAMFRARGRYGGEPPDDQTAFVIRLGDGD